MMEPSERQPSVVTTHLDVDGVQAPVTIERDPYGIPHITATTEEDVWFGQGFASAQDRLWQMEYDRRRAVGRWAEAAGPIALAGDLLARRLQLERAARADIEAMSPPTRRMFTAYAAGVQAFLASDAPLPIEYQLTGLTPERWEPWHSVASFKIRHVLMGLWQTKLAQGMLLARIGPDASARLDPRPPAGSKLLLPPGGTFQALYSEAAAEIVAAADQLGFLAEHEAGSNSWAVHGSHTSSGRPVLCNDSHRQLDVPNVYWQVHLRCPAFSAIGATFPGVPGLPHFGHNGDVGWNITHANADYQDLYVERFSTDPHAAGSYETPDGWVSAERTEAVVRVRGAEPTPVELWRTRHGPIVHGNPRDGAAIALRYTATDRPCRGFETLRPMLAARTVHDLIEAQRPWVDPVNNLVCADVSGNIAYLTRGELPVRSSTAARNLPVPGWTGDHEWTGRVPFERMPRSINPPEGFIATANQRIIAEDDPYVSDIYAVPSRAERIVELLAAKPVLTPEEVMAIQGDTTSRPARAWVRLLASVGPFTGDAERARSLLANWDGNLTADSAAALLYGCYRRRVTQAIFEPIVGTETWVWLMGGALPPTGTMVGRWLAHVIWKLDQLAAAPNGTPWAALLPPVLGEAWTAAVAVGGAHPDTWRWGGVHRTNVRHTLAETFPAHAAELNPPSVELGGDGDTIQAASYALATSAPFDIMGLSVYRQAIDFSDVAGASFVIPAGASGKPGDVHAADQLPLWREHRRVAMSFTEADVAARAVSRLLLDPSAGASRG